MLTAEEQWFLELTNRIRLDPQEAADAYLEGDLNTGVAAWNAAEGTAHDLSDRVSLPALAPNAALIAASRGHSEWMLDENMFSHAGDPALRGHPDYPAASTYADHSNAGERMAAAGYDFAGPWGWAENLASWGSTGQIDARAPVAAHVRGLFESVGHRITTLEESMRETGVGQALGPFEEGGTVFNTSVVTQKFARSGDDLFVTGVIFDDIDGDGAYDPGEGVGGMEVTVGGTATASWSAGGYIAAMSQTGPVQVGFAAAAGEIRVSTTLDGANVKLDLVDGRIVQTSGDLTLLAGATEARILGAAGATLTGNDADNRLQGGSGDDVINAAAGIDTIVFRGDRAEYRIDADGDTVIVAHVGRGASGDGTDRITGAEVLEFADMTVTLAAPPDAGNDPADPDPAGVFALTGHVRLPGGAPLPGVALQMALPGGETRDAMTGPDGSFAMPHDGGTVVLSVAPGLSAPSDGITVADALAVLRMAIGLAPQAGPQTPFDRIAADANRNGAVNVSDALLVLRHAIGLPSDGVGDYLLVDGTFASQGVVAVHHDATVAATLHDDASVDLTAVRLGDIGIYDLIL